MDEKLIDEIEKNYADRLREALDTTGKDKISSYAAVDALKKEVSESYPAEEPETRAMAGKVFGHLKEKIFREDILGNRRRPDGRKFSEIRRITCEVGWLPRAHGSALFTRGETQAIVTTTLGTKMTSSLWTIWKKAKSSGGLCCIIISRRIRSAKRGVSVRRAAAKSDTAIWRAARLKTCCPKKLNFHIRSASSPKLPNRTAQARWLRFAAEFCR